MPWCVLRYCKNNSKNADKSKGITFHSFPKDPIVKEKWINATGKLNWFPTKFSTICSQHFVADDFIVKKSGNKYLKETAEPRINICTRYSLGTSKDAQPSTSQPEADKTEDEKSDESSDDDDENAEDDTGDSENRDEEEEINIKEEPVFETYTVTEQISQPKRTYESPAKKLKAAKPPLKRKASKEDDADRDTLDSRLVEALKILKKSNLSRKKDECDLFGEYIAMSLRKHDDRTQSMIKQAINNILFEQEMKKYSAGHYAVVLTGVDENPLVIGDNDK